MAVSNEQIILAAHERVARYDRDENNLVRIPGLENPVPIDTAISHAVRHLKSDLSEGSRSGKLLARLDEVARNKGILIGVIRKVTLEESSNRGIVHFESVSGSSAGEVETIRTGIISDPDARLVGAEAQALIGHRALMWKDLEPMKSRPGQKARVLIHIEDQGIPFDKRG